MKTFLMTLAVLSALATPAFAQSFSISATGTGNVLPFSWSAAPENGASTAIPQNGLDAFAMVPHVRQTPDSNSPANTGGGSRGYNERLLRD
jgi:hypothetical protein